MLGKMVRQGDVLLIPTSKIPDGAKLEKKRKTVAYGEVTGHHHDLVGTDVGIYALEDQLFAKVGSDVQITHQEHAALAVDEGLYEIRIQQEYTPQEVRRVLD
jgi:hypothetical protein